MVIAIKTFPPRFSYLIASQGDCYNYFTILHLNLEKYHMTSYVIVAMFIFSSAFLEMSVFQNTVIYNLDIPTSK